MATEAQDTNSSGFSISRTTVPTDTPYWQSDVSKVLQPQTRQMLETYARIPSGEVEDRIRATQKHAWELAPFPSIGGLTWLNPYIILHPAYDTILSRVKAGSSILDCGCMVATDLRQLAYAGAPTENMYGFDIEAEFFKIGYDFYNDRTKFHGKFLHVDGLLPFDTDDSPAAPLLGKMDILWCAKFMHLFDYEHQIDLAVKLVSLLKPQAGSMFVVAQNGFPGGYAVPVAAGQGFPGMGNSCFMADVEHIREMWKEVTRRTGIEWDLESKLLDMRTIGLHEDDGSEYKRLTGYNVQWTATMK